MLQIKDMAQTEPQEKHWLFKAYEACERKLARKPIGVRFEDDVDKVLRDMGAYSQGLIRRCVRQRLIEEGYIEESNSLRESASGKVRRG